MGFAFAPLIWNDLIILNPGGDRGAVKAYSKLNGKLVWESELAGKGVYLSPSIHSFLGEMHLLVAVEGKLPPWIRKTGNALGNALEDFSQ